MISDQDVETKVIKASYVLQSKVGSGPLDEEKVRESQRVIETNKVDFAPMGLQFLEQLEVVLEEAKKTDIAPAELREQITQPIMQLKANASMFKYDLVGSLANIMLSFLESIKEVDDEAYEIVGAHHKTLKAIIDKRMEGNGGNHGVAFQNELKDACRRYFSKRNIPVGGVFVVNVDG